MHFSTSVILAAAPFLGTIAAPAPGTKNAVPNTRHMIGDIDGDGKLDWTELEDGNLFTHVPGDIEQEWRDNNTIPQQVNVNGAVEKRNPVFGYVLGKALEGSCYGTGYVLNNDRFKEIAKPMCADLMSQGADYVEDGLNLVRSIPRPNSGEDDKFSINLGWKWFSQTSVDSPTDEICELIIDAVAKHCSDDSGTRGAYDVVWNMAHSFIVDPNSAGGGE